MDTGPTLGKEEGVRSGFGVKKIVRWLASGHIRLYAARFKHSGWVAEWSIAHAWKACLPLSVTRVRIPPHPRLPPKGLAIK